MKILHNIYIAFFALILSVFIFCYAFFQYNLGAPSQDATEKIVEIEPGSIKEISNNLYKEGLIKSKIAFILYSKISGKSNLKAATYTLSKNMGTKKIINILYAGKGKNSNQISITFNEGWNMRRIAKTISQYTNHTEEELYNTLNDQDYMRKLIDRYWFLTDDILNQEIYYSLEGYLYPNTYYFSSKEVKIDEIIEVMLEEMGEKLSSIKDKMEAKSQSIHEIITMASIVELEGTTLEDRKGIASVFQNRLNEKMNLGSDVTTYYGAKVDIGERDLYASELTECNFYNTRCASFTKLPVSPICNPSIDSINAVLDLEETDYYYFVADKNKKIYFSKNLKEHNSTISQLKRDGLWYEY